MPGRDSWRVMVTGVQGSGKSAWARRAVREALGRRPVVTLSTKPTDYGDVVGVVVRIREPVTAYDPAQLADLIRQKRRLAVVLTKIEDMDSRPAFAERLALAVEQVPGTLLVIDEAHLFLPNGKDRPGVLGLLTGGRELGIDWICVTQHAQLVSLTVTREANTFVVFAASNPTDAAYIARYAEAVPQEVQRLRPGEYLFRRQGDPQLLRGRLDLAAEYGGA